MVVLLLITIVGSVLVGWLVPKAFHSKPPYGTAVDILVCTVAGVIWAVITYQVILPMIGLEGWTGLLLSALDAIGLAAVMLLQFQAISVMAKRWPRPSLISPLLTLTRPNRITKHWSRRLSPAGSRPRQGSNRKDGKHFWHLLRLQKESRPRHPRHHPDPTELSEVLLTRLESF
jgi:hypothetical protein